MRGCEVAFYCVTMLLGTLVASSASDSLRRTFVAFPSLLFEGHRRAGCPLFADAGLQNDQDKANRHRQDHVILNSAVLRPSQFVPYPASSLSRW